MKIIATIEDNAHFKAALGQAKIVKGLGIPPIETIHVTVKDKSLQLTFTDRFVVARHRVAVTIDVWEEGEFILGVEDALAWAKQVPARGRVVVTFEDDEAKLQVPGAEFKAKPVDVDYPQIDRLMDAPKHLDKFMTGDEIPGSLWIENLKKFNLPKAVFRDLVVTPNIAGKPAMIHDADGKLHGIAMPYRLPEGRPDVSEVFAEYM